MKTKLHESYLEDLSKDVLSRLKGDEVLTLSYVGEMSQFLRFNRARVRQTGTVEDGNLEFQLLKKGSQGLKRVTAGLSLTGERDLDLQRTTACLKNLQDLAGRLPVDPLAEIPVEGQKSRHVSPGEILPPESVVDEVIVPMQSFDAVGLYSAGLQTRMMKNSLGVSHWFETTNFQVDYSLYTASQRAVKRLHAGQKWESEKFKSDLCEAVDQLKLMDQPARAISRGAYRVFLAPNALSEIIRMFSWGCVSEMAIQQGESPLLKVRKGEVSFSKDFSLAEDFELGFSPRFNSEGELAPLSMMLIDRGTLVSTLISRRTAKEFNLKSTCAPLSESLRSSRVLSGSLEHSKVLDALGDGLYLSNLHYLNWSDQASGRITGMTRFACMLVQRGKMVGPIESMRFDDSIFNLLGGKLESLTRNSEDMPSTSTYGFRALSGIQSPGALVREMHLTL